MSSPPLKILFVDDEELVLRGMQRVLRDHANQWDMTFVDSAAEALRLMEARPYDAVVSDMQMPGMNGAALLNHVMRLHPRTIRIALSGYADRDMILQCVGAAHQYLAKPCDGPTLKSVLERITRLIQTDRDETIRQLVARCPVLPSVPVVYSQLVEALNSPHATLEDIGAIVAADAAMSTQMLKLVNSAFFSLGRRITHPAEATQFLGIEAVKALVLSAHLFLPIARNLPEGVSATRIWTHSQACAGAAKSIAVELGASRSTANEAHVAGLLHDIGKLLLAANLPEEYRQALEFARNEQVALRDSERAVFGADHAEVGGYFLGLLGLPAPVIEAVSFHHQPSLAVSPESIPLAALHLGNAIAAVDAPALALVPHSRVDPGFLDRRGLTHDLDFWRQLGRADEETASDSNSPIASTAENRLS
ncbi:MAG TPA: response regulator [Opitutus sp.]|nr:response regulator [Opitutus sp.]